MIEQVIDNDLIKSIEKEKGYTVKFFELPCRKDSSFNKVSKLDVIKRIVAETAYYYKYIADKSERHKEIGDSTLSYIAHCIFLNDDFELSFNKCVQDGVLNPLTPEMNNPTNVMAHRNILRKRVVNSGIFYKPVDAKNIKAGIIPTEITNKIRAFVSTIPEEEIVYTKALGFVHKV